MVWFICSRQLPINKFFTAGVDIKLQCASPTAHLHWCVTFLVSGLKQLTLATSHFRDGTVFWLHQQATISSVALDITHFHISTYQFPKSEFQKQFSKSKPSVPVSASRSHSSQVKWHPLTDLQFLSPSSTPVGNGRKALLGSLPPLFHMYGRLLSMRPPKELLL